MELKKNWNSNGNIAGGDRLQLLGFCLGQTDSTVHDLHTYGYTLYSCTYSTGSNTYMTCTVVVQNLLR